MAFCGKCGAKIEDGVTVCPACGAPVEVQPVENAAPQEQPAAAQPQVQQNRVSGENVNANVNAAVSNAADSAKKMFNDLNNTKDTTAQYDSADIETNKLWAILSYISFLFFLPLVCCPNSKFGKFHANQGLVLFIVDVIAWVLILAVGWIPVIGTIIKLVIGLVLLVMMVIGIVNAVNGKAKELPIIGGIVILK